MIWNRTFLIIFLLMLKVWVLSMMWKQSITQLMVQIWPPPLCFFLKVSGKKVNFYFLVTLNIITSHFFLKISLKFKSFKNMWRFYLQPKITFNLTKIGFFTIVYRCVEMGRSSPPFKLKRVLIYQITPNLPGI